MYLFTQVQFVKRKDHQNVIIYYSKNGEKFRRSTGVRVLSKNITSKGAISSSHPNYEEDMKKIKELQNRIEDIVISYKEKYGEKPSIEWLEKQFDKPLIDARKDLNDALCYWKEFIAEKEQTIRNEGTIKRYNNLEGTLNKFQEKKNYRISFDTLDQKFFNDFLSYMVNEHEYVRNPHLRRPEHALKPEVGLANETAIKRLKDFTEYLKYCTVEHDININLEKVKKFIKLAKHKQEVRPLSKTQKWELTLTSDEIQFVVNLDYYEPDFWKSLSDNQKRYLDILVFMCLQGTAPIDTKDIKKTDVRNGRIIKDRSKSGNEFKVDLDLIAEEILARNSYNLDFTDQTVNGELKHLFVTIFELYRRYYDKKHDEPYEILCTQKIKKGDREILRIEHKGLFVELMTGRRSFLTNLGEKADELGIKEMMSQAGHTVIGTTLGYIHERQQSKKSKGGLFNIFKIVK
jgi:Phage integrase SAM-like domain